MCQVVGIQMDGFQMKKLPPWAQNNLQRDTYVSINFNPPFSLIYWDPLGFRGPQNTSFHKHNQYITYTDKQCL